jgi:hypothetical protein
MAAVIAVTVARAVTAVHRGGKADAKVVRAAKADQAAVRVDHAAASANISARKKFASSASKKWI